jgi:ribonuclease Y
VFFIGPILDIVIPLVSAAVVGCICWIIARKRSFKKGYDTRKAEAEAIFGSAEAEGKRLVSEAVKEGEAKKREFLLLAKEEIHKSRIEKYYWNI